MARRDVLRIELLHEGDHVLAIAHAELLVDAGGMGLHGPFGKEQGVLDVRSISSLSQQDEHLGFAGRKPIAFGYAAEQLFTVRGDVYKRQLLTIAGLLLSERGK